MSFLRENYRFDELKRNYERQDFYCECLGVGVLTIFVLDLSYTVF